jgi:hypothetical protein
MRSIDPELLNLSLVAQIKKIWITNLKDGGCDALEITFVDGRKYNYRYENHDDCMAMFNTIKRRK